MASPFQRQQREEPREAPHTPSPATARFSPREASEVISLATRVQQQRARVDDALLGPAAADERLTMQQVIEIAQELGIPRQDVMHALDRRLRPPATQRLRSGRRKLGDTLYRWHVAAYASAVAGTGIIDLLLTDGWDIAVVTAAGWGILVGTHTLGRLFSRRGTFARPE